MSIGLFQVVSVEAQVIPDATLSTNSTVFNTGVSIEIDGGTRVGNSLFHSFEQFSISNGETVSFQNPVNIETVFSRITGVNSSEINGILQSEGMANFFLINPNGIILGEDAELDVGGSFFASTADYIEFSDNIEFSASNPDFQPLLNISLPVGLGFTSNAADITNRSLFGLEVPEGEILALIGGNVTVDSSTLFVENGDIELGAVDGPGIVSLSFPETEIEFDYSSLDSFQDVRILNASEVGVDGDGVGRVNIYGRQIFLREGSIIFNDTLEAAAEKGIFLTATESVELSGASENGNSTGIFSTALSGSGAAGDIVIDTKRVTMRDGALLIVEAESTTSPNQAGDIKIRATESVELIGMASDMSPSSIAIDVFDRATGQNSVLHIETQTLMLREGALIATNTDGSGQGADLSINASESILLSGDLTNNDALTGLFSSSSADSTGNAGSIRINTQQFTAENGAQVSSDTLGEGDAGDLILTATQLVRLLNTSKAGNIASGLFAQVNEDESGNVGSGDAGTLRLNTNQLEIIGGAQISTAARGEGQGGTLIITVADSILVSGTSVLEDFRSSSNIIASAEPGATSNGGQSRITADRLTVENGGRISADNFGSGDGSTATINVRQLLIQDGGRVGAGSLVGDEEDGVNASELGPGGTLTINASERIEISGSRRLNAELVNSQLFTRAEGSGAAGNLIINATQDSDLIILVRDGAEISANTEQSTGGNIVVNNPNVILLRTGGRITAASSSSLQDGNSGNITLTMPDGFVVSVPDENSDIVANAIEGAGGNITITAQGIFNLVERPLNDITNDINASSRFGESGTVILNNLSIDPTQDLAELPVDTTAPTVAQRCFADSSGQNAFVITGQGGTSPTPGNIIRNESVGIVDLGSDIIVSAPNRTDTTVNSYPTTEAVGHITEAQGWQRDEADNVVLIAPTISPSYTFAQHSAICPAGLGG